MTDEIGDKEKVEPTELMDAQREGRETRDQLWQSIHEDTPERFRVAVEWLEEKANPLVEFAEEIGRELFGLGSEASDEQLHATESGPIEAAPETTEKVEAFDVETWKSGPTELGFVTEEHLADRFRPLRNRTNLKAYVEDLIKRDVGVRSQFEKIRDQRASPSIHDQQRALEHLRRNLAGSVAECIAKDALKPFFSDVTTQVREQLDDGRSTFVDLKFEGALQKMRFGRAGLVPEGGNLDVEVKAGKAEYLRQEKDHIQRQVAGQKADLSVVVVSKDADALPPNALREPAANAGATVRAFLPYKQQLDKVLMELVPPGQTQQ